MKNRIITAAAAACAVMAIAVPDWKASLNAMTGAYGEVDYQMQNAAVSQTIAVSGCKVLKASSTTDVELYKDGTFYFGMSDGSPVQGKWTKVPGKSSDTFYLSLNRTNLAWMLDAVDKAALANCSSKMTTLNTVDPTVLVSKNTIVVKVKDNKAKGTLQFKGLQQNDSKGGSTPVTGNINATMTLTGTMVKQP